MENLNEQLTGKIIERVEPGPMGMWMDMIFADGSVARLSPGRASCHNDAWSTIQVEMLDNVSA